MNHTLVLTKDGKLLTMGENGSGQLGQGTFTPSSFFLLPSFFLPTTLFFSLVFPL
jgi:alpha-tubulin suppressor-like RCC1 family protein